MIKLTKGNTETLKQASSSNTNEANAGAVVETGLMFLSDGQDVTTTKYNNPTSYKVYDAE